MNAELVGLGKYIATTFSCSIITSRMSFMTRNKINGKLPRYLLCLIFSYSSILFSYFVDFEDVWVDPKKPAPTFFSDLEYEIWWLDDKKLGLVDSADSADQKDNDRERCDYVDCVIDNAGQRKS